MPPELISKAQELPEVEYSNDDEDESEEMRKPKPHGDPRMQEDKWQQIYSSLEERLREWNLYWQVFEPREDPEAIRGSLADDIADICRDLKEGIDLGEAGQTPARDIVFEWWFGFYSHWGKHAIDALRTIHFLIPKAPS